MEKIIRQAKTKGNKYRVELIECYTNPNTYEIKEYVNDSLRGCSCKGKITRQQAVDAFDELIEDNKTYNGINYIRNI